MKPTPIQWLLAGFTLAVLLSGGVVWFNLRHADRLLESSRWVTHTELVRDSLGQLLTGLLDIMKSERGYVLTGDASYLEPYEAALKAQTAEIHNLRTLTKDNPEQQHNLDTLEPLVKRLVEYSGLVVQLRRASGLDPAQTQVASGAGKETLDAARAVISTMQQMEDHLLAARIATTQRQTDEARHLSLAGSSLSLLLLLIVFALVLRESRLRQRANVALQNSEENLSVTLQSIGEGVLAVDPAGRITRLNAVAETLMGWKQADAVGRPAGEVFHILNELTREPGTLPLAATLTQGTIHELANHTLLIARDGTERSIAESCSPIRNREGLVTGAVLIFRDVTAERNAAQQLEEMHSRLELIFRSVADGLHGLKLDGTINFTNPAADRMLGYGRLELLGQPEHAAVHRHHADGTEYPVEQCPVDITLRDGRTRRVVDEVFWRKDGTCVPVEYLVSAIVDDQGRRSGAIVAFRDVSERQQAEREIRTLNAQLERRVAERTAQLASANVELAQGSRLKDEFLANMSHELRTPLNAVLGLSEALLEQVAGPLTPRQVKSITTISTSGQHLLTLINDILDLSKIEAGKLELHAEPLCLDEFCQSCLVFVRTQAMQKQIGVTFEHDGSTNTFLADPKRFKQVLVNLLSNAVKFTPVGGRIGLSVAAPAGEEEARFTVWDTGIGIAAADTTRLFRAFSQIDSGLSRAQEGTGLGLALVAKLVELQGGSVAVESEPGKGSRFTVTLPMVGVELLTVVPEPPADVPSLPSQAIRRVLVIEDDPTAREQLVHYVTELGLTSVAHPRGAEAMEAVLRERPDAILLDVQLPGESGWVVLAKLKEHPHTRDIPVAIVSIVDEPEKSRALGATAHFTKPITRDQLAGFLQRAPIKKSLPVVSLPPEVCSTGPIILLAEDNEANIQTTGGYLNDRGYSMHYAANGLVAVKLATELHPALILMDIQMPVMDGLTAIRTIREDATLQGVPIIALTALAMPGDRERCLAAGATEYLSKPVRLKQLAELVDQLLSNTHATQRPTC